jgi:asparagine synthase (glutamine-hydrolysing)
MKIHDGYPKWILRKMMEKRLDESIVWRKGKTGFEPPQQEWMTDPAVRDLIMDARKKLVDGKILKPSVLQKKIRGKAAHDSDNYDWRYLCAARTIMK